MPTYETATTIEIVVDLAGAEEDTLDTIPGPLRDRMEILQLSGYTDEEKVGIARQYLIPKQLAAHGIAPAELEFEPGALRQMVRGYTREAGVRGLEREIATVARARSRSRSASSSRPTWNMYRTIPSCAIMPRCGAIEGGRTNAAASGDSRPNNDGPSAMPAITSPITGGWPMYPNSHASKRTVATTAARASSR